MQIKHQALESHLQHKTAALYCLIGQDNYLLEESSAILKKHLCQQHQCEEKRLSLHTVEDWQTLIEEANSYSLFSDVVLIHAVFEKKTIDAAAKKILTAYLDNNNPRCFIIIQAPNLQTKQVTWLVQHTQSVVVMAYTLTAQEMKKWISTQLTLSQFTYAPEIPELIHQYTQGNMLACAQVIEKIRLTNEPGCLIKPEDALEQLSAQYHHTLFELSDACLLGDGRKVIQILRQAAQNKSEPTLVLWLITQEIRLLWQLSFLLQQGTAYSNACSQLKIWPQRASLYQPVLKRLSTAGLKSLLHCSHLIDEQIKSNSNPWSWNSLEQLALELAGFKTMHTD